MRLRDYNDKIKTHETFNPNSYTRVVPCKYVMGNVVGLYNLMPVIVAFSSEKHFVIRLSEVNSQHLSGMIYVDADYTDIRLTVCDMFDMVILQEHIVVDSLSDFTSHIEEIVRDIICDL